jgi:hypothetical protein
LFVSTVFVRWLLGLRVCFPNRLSVREPFAGDALDRERRPRRVVEPKCCAVVRCLAHMVINAVDAALDDRKEAFNGIGVSVAPNVLISRMIDRAMTGELLSNLPIDAAFIGTKMRICGFGDFVTRVVLRLVREADALGGAVEISGDRYGRRSDDQDRAPGISFR